MNLFGSDVEEFSDVGRGMMLMTQFQRNDDENDDDSDDDAALFDNL